MYEEITIDKYFGSNYRYLDEYCDKITVINALVCPDVHNFIITNLHNPFGVTVEYHKDIEVYRITITIDTANGCRSITQTLPTHTIIKQGHKDDTILPHIRNIILEELRDYCVELIKLQAEYTTCNKVSVNTKFTLNIGG